MKRALLCVLVLLICVPVFAQQSYVNRYDIFTGYSYLRIPLVSLNEHGFNGSMGVNMNRWLAFGSDFSIFTGSTGLTVNQTQLAPTLTPLIGTTLANSPVPIDAKTYTFAAGPQINIRKMDKVTIFVRPGLGLIHQSIKLNYAGTPFAALLPVLGANPTLAAALNASQTDTVPFYGFGGGIDVNASKHVGFRVSADYVRSSLFKGLLAPQNNVRLSFGPTWRFGELRQKK